MRDKIEAWKEHVREVSGRPEFVHHEWFVRWHLEIVERIALELCNKYPQADRDLVEVMVWLHDYGKILDFDNQYAVTLSSGKAKLTEMGFTQGLVERAVKGIEILDRKDFEELANSAIEIQIVSSADGCSHLVGPFFNLWWYENPGKPWQELMANNRAKHEKDWYRKITLPEARAAFAARHNFLLEQTGELPEKFLN